VVIKKRVKLFYFEFFTPVLRTMTNTSQKHPASGNNPLKGKTEMLLHSENAKT